MDCFYAAIEVRDHPELRGEPVAVGGRSSRRGVLTTCNYEARAFGIHSAMPTFQAMLLCPHLIVMPVRPAVYRQESRRIRQILSDYTERIEPLSLDEAYLDVSEREEDPSSLAKDIRSRIRETTGLDASAGIAPNKMLAKIASDWRKPNGQFEIRPRNIEAFMKELPISKIWGIGKKTEAKLLQGGISRCADLQALSIPELESRLGKFGGELYQLCRGIDNREIVTNRIRKSMSCERTYARDLQSLEDKQEHAAEIFRELSEDLVELKSDRPVTKLFVKCKYADFTLGSIERSRLAYNLDSFLLLLSELHARRPEAIRLLGLGTRFADPIRQKFPKQLAFEFADSS